jgi:type VI secretion system secreted protein Hcp
MAINCYLQLEGIQGEEQNQRFPNSIRVLSYHYNATVPATGEDAGGALAAGKPDISDLVITKYVDSTSPQLFKAVVTAQNFPTATMTVEAAGTIPHPIMKFVLKNAMVSGFTVNPSGDDNPSETVSFSFTAIEMHYVQMGPDGHPRGTVPASYDVQEMKAI